LSKAGTTLAQLEEPLNSVVNAIDPFIKGFADIRGVLSNYVQAVSYISQVVNIESQALTYITDALRGAEVPVLSAIPDLLAPTKILGKVGGVISYVTAGIGTVASALDSLSFNERLDWGGQLLGVSVEGGNGVVSGSASLDLFAYDAYAEANGGFYSYDKDGNRIFNPHINAEVGGSFTVIHGEAQGTIGNDMLGLNGYGSVTLGHISAVAGASIGLFDANGNFNPSANVGVDLQAVVAEANAKAGITVLGHEIVSAEIGVNFGIGAHANIGFKDGKFSFDIGATLGIGYNIAFQIDFGGMVNAVKGIAESAIKGITNLAESVVDTAKKVVNAVVGAAESAIDWLVDTGEKVVNAVKSAAVTVGNAISNAAKAVGKWFASW
jgi:hypothetical protein